MTMVFRVRDAAMLKQVKPGDKVLFEAEKASAGFTITKLEKDKQGSAKSADKPQPSRTKIISLPEDYLPSNNDRRIA